jgi:hypothetical protein
MSNTLIPGLILAGGDDRPLLLSRGVQRRHFNLRGKVEMRRVAHALGQALRDNATNRCERYASAPVSFGSFDNG